MGDSYPVCSSRKGGKKRRGNLERLGRRVREGKRKGRLKRSGTEDKTNDAMLDEETDKKGERRRRQRDALVRVRDAYGRGC